MLRTKEYKKQFAIYLLIVNTVITEAKQASKKIMFLVLTGCIVSGYTLAKMIINTFNIGG